MKKIISLILAVLMLTPFLPVSYAEGTEDSIRIDKKYLALGDGAAAADYFAVGGAFLDKLITLLT